MAWAIEFLPEAAKELKKLDRTAAARINARLAECQRDPFRGTGKLEPLRQNLTGWWSRRIAGEHRLVYRVRGTGDGQAVEVLSCRYHY